MKNHSTMRFGAWAVVLICLSSVLGCEKPPVVRMGQQVSAGGIQFEVSDYDVRYVEIYQGEKTFEYAQPVLVIPITLTNAGKKSFIYTPTHKDQQMTEASTPLLYPAPGADQPLPPPSKTPIKGVYLEKGALPNQLTQPKTLQPGESVTDLFVFETPDTAQQLILNIPPAFHRGELPVLYRIDYKPRQAKGPKVIALGQSVEFDGVNFTVQSAESVYVKIEDAAQGEGYTSEPLFKVTYKLENVSEQPFTYEPSHRAVAGSPGAMLYSTAEGPYKRAQFAATTSPEGQVVGKKTIEPGESATDYVLFERPDKEVETVQFQYPASLFERSGVVRVRIPYEYTQPEKPKELQKALKDKDKDEG